jgi:hypothetical protein
MFWSSPKGAKAWVRFRCVQGSVLGQVVQKKWQDLIKFCKVRILPMFQSSIFASF